MALRPGRQRLSATPIIAKGLLYPLQNRPASKSATHGFASKSATRHRKKHLPRQVLFSVIFACGEFYCFAVIFGLRRVIFASQVWVANIISLRNEVEQYHCRLQQYHADEVSISLKTSTLKFFEIL